MLVLYKETYKVKVTQHSNIFCKQWAKTKTSLASTLGQDGAIFYY